MEVAAASAVVACELLHAIRSTHGHNLRQLIVHAMKSSRHLLCCAIVVSLVASLIPALVAKDTPRPAAQQEAHRYWPPAMGIAEAVDGEALRVTEFFEYDAAQVGEDVKTSLGDVEASQKILLDEIVAQRVDGTLVAPADVVKAFKKSGPIILSSKIPPDRTFLPLFKPDAIILQWPIQP